jgi:hypothetical protein
MCNKKAIQDSIYSIFISDPASEKFFEKIHYVLSVEITRLTTIDGTETDFNPESLSFPIQIIEVLRLFCENHHTELQNYIRHQSQSKVQYDMVALVIKVLLSCSVNDLTYPILIKCNEALTEFSQGPCEGNQKLIASKGFIEYTAALLKNPDKIKEPQSSSNNPVSFNAQTQTMTGLSDLMKAVGPLLI